MSSDEKAVTSRFQLLIEELVAVHVREVDQLQVEVDRLRQSNALQDRRSPSPTRNMSPPLKEVDVQCQPKVETEGRDRRNSSKETQEIKDINGEIGTASMVSVSRFSLGSELGLDLGSEATSEDAEVHVTRLQAFVMSGAFESMVAGLLFVNICLMAAQLQILGMNIGYDIGYRRYTLSPDKAWAYFDDFFFYADLTFAVLFTLEMMLRQFYLGFSFFRYGLNWLDFLVVCSSWVELFAAGLPINPTFLRMLRLGKLLRAVRVVRMSQVLESLQLLLKCIAASVKILFWSLFLLMIIQISAGMSISYLVSEYLVDPDVPIDERMELFRYYGTCTKTLLTMFEVLFANWAPPARVLIDNVSEWYSLVFIIYRCFVGFAVLNVVNAVFVQSTMKVAQADDEFMLQEKKKAEDAYRRKVTTLFRQVDTSGDGKIDAQEFKRLLKAPKLQAWLSQLEIETRDLWGLFKMLDQGEGEISLKDFEEGTMRIKGWARSYDVAQLNASLFRLHNKIDAIVTMGLEAHQAPSEGPRKGQQLVCKYVSM